MASPSFRTPSLVFVASSWIEATAGTTYTYSTYSSLLKSSLRYNQQQITALGVAKDLGDTVGLAAGFLSNVLPSPALICIGALLNLLGYGGLWLLVIHKIGSPSFWVACMLIFVGTNGSTYYDTAALVSNINNYPRSRGTVVGILKGFKGLCGAIFGQIYVSFFAPDQTAFMFMLAVFPTMVAIPLMLIIRPINTSHGEKAHADAGTFSFIYGVCLVLATYLMAVILLQDLLIISEVVKIIFTVGLLVLIMSPLAAPIYSSFISGRSAATFFCFRRSDIDLEAPLLRESTGTVDRPSSLPHSFILKEDATTLEKASCSDICKENFTKVDSLRESPRKKKEGMPQVKRECSQREEDLPFQVSLMKADFWLLFFSVCFGAGSGVTAINNLGQMAQSQGYENAQIFVSLISIWSFLGRLAGGQSSEFLARNRGFPRPVVLAVAQLLMSFGHFLFAMAWPGSLYIGSLIVGLCYGAHWSIFPPTCSELFGMRSFSILYNCLCMAVPAGSLIFSGLIAGSLYDREAKKQNMILNFTTNFGAESLQCKGSVCFQLTFLIMTAVCIVGMVLSVVLVLRTKALYSTLYSASVEHEHHESSDDEEGKQKQGEEEEEK